MVAHCNQDINFDIYRAWSSTKSFVSKMDMHQEKVEKLFCKCLEEAKKELT